MISDALAVCCCIIMLFIMVCVVFWSINGDLVHCVAVGTEFLNVSFYFSNLCQMFQNLCLMCQNIMLNVSKQLWVVCSWVVRHSHLNLTYITVTY